MSPITNWAMMSPRSNVVSISAFLLWNIVRGDTENTKYSPQFHPTTYFAKDVKRALNAFGAAEKFTWPDLRLLDLHEYNPEWTSGSMRLEQTCVASSGEMPPSPT